jgi:hypothetical protein
MRVLDASGGCGCWMRVLDADVKVVVEMIVEVVGTKYLET